MNTFFSRLFQPSSFAGMAALAQSSYTIAMQTPGPVGIGAAVASGIAGLFAIVINDGSTQK